MINELSVKLMNAELALLLDAFSAKHSLKRGNQRISYARDGSTMKMTVEFGDKSTTGDLNPAFHRALSRGGFRYGLSVSDIGKMVRTGKGQLRFVGMQGKFAIAEAADKSLYKYDAVMMATLLKSATV
jgi:hypothetical protein